MSKLLRFGRDERGAAVIEIAIALPVLVVFVWGLFQVGVAFQANAGMQHALGEGARMATICKNPTSAGVCSVATDSEIVAKMNDKTFGTGIGTFTVASPVTGADYKDLSVSFTMPMNFLLFNGPNVTLTRTKRVYVAT